MTKVGRGHDEGGNIIKKRRKNARGLAYVEKNE